MESKEGRMWGKLADAWNRKAKADKELLEIYREKLAELQRDREHGKIDVDDLNYQVESRRYKRIINNLS